MHKTWLMLLALLGVLLLGAHSADFTLSSPAFTDGGTLPVEFTGDGISPPLEWCGAPAGTRGYALIMHHVAPDMTKWYWLLYNIPAETHSLPKGVTGVGLPGTNSVNGQLAYAPPHSKGPGPKTYILTLYAVDTPLHFDVPAKQITRDSLLAAMNQHVLGSAEVHVTYTRSDNPEPHR